MWGAHLSRHEDNPYGRLLCLARSLGTAHDFHGNIDTKE